MIYLIWFKLHFYHKKCLEISGLPLRHKGFNPPMSGGEIFPYVQYAKHGKPYCELTEPVLMWPSEHPSFSDIVSALVLSNRWARSNIPIAKSQRPSFI